MKNTTLTLKTKYAEILEKYAYAERLDYFHAEYDDQIIIYFDSLFQMHLKIAGLVEAGERGYVIPWNQFEETDESINLSQNLPIKEFKRWVYAERERQYNIWLTEQK
jgi:hypothetical protein